MNIESSGTDVDVVNISNPSKLFYKLNGLREECINIDYEIDQAKKYILENIHRVDRDKLESIFEKSIVVPGLLHDIKSQFDSKGETQKTKSIEMFGKMHKEYLNEQSELTKTEIHGGGNLSLLLALLQVCAVIAYQAIHSHAILKASEHFQSYVNKEYQSSSNPYKTRIQRIQSSPSNLNTYVSDRYITPRSDEFRYFARKFLTFFLNSHGQCVYNSEFLIGNNPKIVEKHFTKRIETALSKKIENPTFGVSGTEFNQVPSSHVTVSSNNVLEVARAAGMKIYDDYLNIRKSKNSINNNDVKIENEDIIVGFSFRYFLDNMNIGHAVSAYVRKIGNEYKIAMADMNNIETLVFVSSNMITSGNKLFVVEPGFFNELEKRSFDTSTFVEENANPVLHTIGNTYTTLLDTETLYNANSKHMQKIHLTFETPDNGSILTPIFNVIFNTNVKTDGGILASLPIFNINETNFNKIVALKEKLYRSNINNDAYTLYDTRMSALKPRGLTISKIMDAVKFKIRDRKSKRDKGKSTVSKRDNKSTESKEKGKKGKTKKRHSRQDK
jgi:hypothetical protein